jgi:hypothetical protein
MSSDSDDQPASTTDEEPVEADDGVDPDTKPTGTEQATAGANAPGDTAFVWTDVDGSDATDRTTESGNERAEDGAETTARDAGSHTEADTGESDGRERLTPERYLLAGETVVDRHETRAGWVAVTTHRLLAFDPEGDGKRFEAVDRANVVAVRTADGGSAELRSALVRALGYAVVLLGGGLVGRSLGLRSLFSTPTGTDAGAVGLGGLLSVLSLVGAFVGLVVDLLLVAGVVAALAAVGLGVWYLRSRRSTLVVERAGEAAVSLAVPTATAGDRIVDALERELHDELAVGGSESKSWSWS